MKYLVLTLTCLSFFSGSFATADNQKIDMKKDFSSLGDNDAVEQRAKALDPKNKYKAVQGRAIDMNMRLEMGVNYGLTSGGDPYYSTQTLGANLDFHLNPNWSIGGRYYHSYNALNAEGQNAFQSANSNFVSGVNYNTPAIDYPSDTTLGVINWYPIYGKLDLFGQITHFDIYFLGGYGVTELNSGAAGTLALGGGFGLWLTQHITARLEARYQEYNDHPYFDLPQSYTRQINQVVYMGSIGFML